VAGQVSRIAPDVSVYQLAKGSALDIPVILYIRVVSGLSHVRGASS
jgi:hypothetical protein